MTSKFTISLCIQAEVILEVAAKSGTAADVLLKQQPFAEPGDD